MATEDLTSAAMIEISPAFVAEHSDYLTRWLKLLVICINSLSKLIDISLVVAALLCEGWLKSSHLALLNQAIELHSADSQFGGCFFGCITFHELLLRDKSTFFAIITYFTTLLALIYIVMLLCYRTDSSLYKDYHEHEAPQSHQGYSGDETKAD